jgi:hypothetical protein
VADLVCRQLEDATFSFFGTRLLLREAQRSLRLNGSLLQLNKNLRIEGIIH